MPKEANQPDIMGSNIEGWTWLVNSKKWHYFSEQRSLCRKFALLRHPSEGYEHGADDSPDNCAACRKKLEQFGRRS